MLGTLPRRHERQFVGTGSPPPSYLQGVRSGATLFLLAAVGILAVCNADSKGSTTWKGADQVGGDGLWDVSANWSNGKPTGPVDVLIQGADASDMAEGTCPCRSTSASARA